MTVTLRLEAATDIVQTAQWYEDRSKGLGFDFVTEVDRAMARAEQGAKHYRLVYRQLRCIHLRRFPYSIYFVSYEAGIQVIAVMHHRRNPQTWKERAE